MAKEFLGKNQIEYVEADVGSDPGARKELIDKSGQIRVPVILVDNEVIVGFDKEKLERLLKRNF